MPKKPRRLAILCDDQQSWQPTSFRYGRWGCKTELVFRIAKLLVYAKDEAGLERCDNPFAALVLAHAKARETRQDPLKRKEWKLLIAKSLYARNWTKDQVLHMLVFLDWVMQVPDELEEAFGVEFLEFEEERDMKYIPSWERIAAKKG